MNLQDLMRLKVCLDCDAIFVGNGQNECPKCTSNAIWWFGKFKMVQVLCNEEGITPLTYTALLSTNSARLSQPVHLSETEQ